MTKYDSYKPSGIEWIGDVPEHWELIKTNLITENLDGKRIPLNSEERGNRSGDYPYWGSNGIVDYIDDYLFDEELVLIGEDGSPFFEKFKSVSFYVTGKIWVNNHIHILRPKEKILPKFLTYSFNCVDYKGFITGSTRDKLTQSDLNKIYHCVPPTFEQSHIIKFLDEKTEIIDKLISTKERKIELLKEQRTSLINQVITKGLDPNVKMKDIGVEWIGEIPEHWRIKKVKYLLKEKEGIKIGPFGSSLKLDTLSEEGIKIYGQGNIIKDDFSLGERYIPLQRFIEDFSQYEILEGDVLVTMMGTTGKSKVFSNKYKRGILDSHLLRLRFNERLLKSYLFTILLEKGDYLFHQLKLNSKGSIMEGLNSSIIKELLIVTPPIDEQERLLKYMDYETQEIDNLISLEQKKIELLKEYRQSLISEVVTGKIDVRRNVN